MRLPCSIAFLVLGLSLVAQSDPLARFDEGLRLYRENKIDGAVSAWESILQSGEASGPTYFNLGNAYFRKGDYGRSILYYERARADLPRERDLQANLEEARRRIVDRIDPPIRLAIWNWVDALRDTLTLRELAAALQALGVIAALVAALRLLQPWWARRIVQRVMVASLGLFILAGAWYGWRAVVELQPRGVIMAEKTDVYSAPDDGSKQLFALHNGTSVKIGETLTGWTRIALVDGRQGWISAADLEKI
ncbi:tetratricopeptide repeat protein [candidate division KSB1 bacterium]|nr:tetratricopeptide repeat protein [candidate division KSB1 bacterium]